MSGALFDGKNQIKNEEVIEKIKYFEEKANKAFQLLQKNKSESLGIAKELRKELEIEYKNNNLNRIQKFYSDHKLFSAFYSPAVSKALVNTIGRLSYKNLNSFLYDIQDYMDYYTPQEYK